MNTNCWGCKSQMTVGKTIATCPDCGRHATVVNGKLSPLDTEVRRDRLVALYGR